MQLLRSALPSHGDYYVVTHDVATRLQAFRSSTISVPQQADPMFDRFHSLLQQKIQGALGGVTVHTIHIDDLARSIWEQVRHLVNGHMVVSSCAEFIDALKVDGFTLNVNRLFDENGELVGYGPRPGCDPLEKQIDDLVAKANGRSVMLLEEGAFSGGTIRFILGQLKARGVEVSLIAIGFCTPVVRDYILEVFDGQLVVVKEIGELLDWITDHDLVPFTPGCGRVLSKRSAEGNVCAYPYILPFGKMGEWTSLPDDLAHELSKFCLESGIVFFEAFEKEDGSPITISDLLSSYPGTPIPLMVGTGAAVPPMETGVVKFLKSVLEKLG